MLLELIRQIIQRTRRYEIALMRESRNVAVATANHKEIMAALRKRDLRAACAALKNNLRTGREPILAWLKARPVPHEKHHCLCRRPAGAQFHGGTRPGTNRRTNCSVSGLARRTFTPALQGELTLRRSGESWRATHRRRGSAMREPRPARYVVRSPQNRGLYRGALANGEPGAGWWIRPSGETADRNDPGGSGQSFAGRVELRKTGADEWRGTVQPLEDRFNLYLRISHNEDGALVGAFRNPDLNSNGGASYFLVSREGDTVRFYRRAPDGTEIRQEATLARSPDRLKIFWKDLGRAIELTRREPAQAAASFPRPKGEPKYVYRKPPENGDGWSIANAREVGLDEAALARLVQRLIDVDPFVRGAPLIHSILVARRGKLVLEEYFFGHSRETPHDTRSAGKTFSSIMLGSAMLQGVKVSQETPIYELLAERGPIRESRPPQGADHARASDDPQLGSGLRRLQPRLARQ